jgi:hypothetical protein
MSYYAVIYWTCPRERDLDMSKVVTAETFELLVQQASAMQHGALCDAIGSFRFIRECDCDLLGAAQEELGRYRRDMAQWARREIEEFEPLDRELLARAWADHHVAEGVMFYGWKDERKAASDTTLLPAGVAGYKVSYRTEAFETIGVVCFGDEVVGKIYVNRAGHITYGRNRTAATSAAAALLKVAAAHQAGVVSTRSAAAAMGCPC